MLDDGTMKFILGFAIGMAVSAIICTFIVYPIPGVI